MQQVIEKRKELSDTRFNAWSDTCSQETSRLKTGEEPMHHQIQGHTPTEITEDTEPAKAGFTDGEVDRYIKRLGAGLTKPRGGLTIEEADSLANRSAAYRELHSLTQEELAEMAGFTRNTLHSLEAGRGASKAVRKKLAALFRVSPASLLNPDISWRAPGRNIQRITVKDRVLASA